MKTKVIFLIEQEKPENVLAFFPEDKYSALTDGVFACYSRIGQHSGCHIDYAKECKLATPEQHNDLAIELVSIGYDLEIINELPK